MKTFALGLIVGVLLCFAFIRFAGSDGAKNAVIEPAPANGTASVTAQPSEPLSCPEPPPIAEAAKPSPPPAVIQRVVEKRPIAIEALSEKEASELCVMAHQLRQKREQATRDAEPKDAGWAYPMEQLIQQHVQSLVPADQYSKLTIECRTTFCELKMESTTDAGIELADKAARTIPNQAWSDIAPKGSSRGADGKGTFHMRYEWYRPRTEAERRMFFRHREQP
jgi:hypothetical protein